MDKNYLKALEVLEKAKRDIEKIMDVADYKSKENTMIFHALENWITSSDDVIRDINYLRQPTKEGQLLEGPAGKFFVVYDDGKESHDLSCGEALELYQGDEWHIGRVEHRTSDDGKGYYFYGLDSRLFLHRGMRVRRRIFD